MTIRSKVTFPGHQDTHGESYKLTGLLESPRQITRGYALFAHCFTCGKDIAAASRVARALVAKGFAVLRFDFTGLGNSDGDFANSNFSSNVADLIAAADYLRNEYQAPALLIGHSLGGAAVLKAAAAITESKAVVTIGAPAEPEHVIKNFSCDVAEIETKGAATVSLAGRPFHIKKQFLDDLRQQDNAYISSINKALLIFHSPLDTTVSIQEAEKIYSLAKHPKSFVSLDKADHLLSQKQDAEYVAETLSAWASRYIAKIDNEQHITRGSIQPGQVIVKEKNLKFAQLVATNSHQWLADEPITIGGDDLGPDPYAHLLAALGTCTAMTLRMYAQRKQLPMDAVEIELSHSRDHGADCQHCDQHNPQIDLIERKIIIKGDLSPQQKQRLVDIADKL